MRIEILNKATGPVDAHLRSGPNNVISRFDYVIK